MKTTGVITEDVYRSWVEFKVKSKRGLVKAQTLTDETTSRLYYIITLFPAVFFLCSHFLFHMNIVAAGIVAAFWFLSFIIAGVLYHQGIIRAATKRPTGVDLDKPREYAIEGGWLVTRTPDTENRLCMSRVSELVVNPMVSFLLCADLGPIVLPFGSGSERADQLAFLEAVRKEIRDSKSA